jgi:hypothetical protein
MKQIRIYTILLVLVELISCDTALEKDLRGKKVTLLGPINNLVTTDTIQTFYWEKLDGATVYQLQIVSPRFDSIVRLIIDTAISGNILAKDLDVNSYQWKVRASNEGSMSDQSDTWKLKIQ